MEITVKTDKVEEMLNASLSVPKEMLTQFGKSVYDNVKMATPVDTGALAGSWVPIPMEDMFVITNPVRYGIWVNWGTGVYKRGTPIVPKTKPYLAFKKDGRWVRTKSVKGQPPQKFVEKGIENAVRGFSSTAEVVFIKEVIR